MNAYSEITARRPNGNIETVRKDCHLTDRLFASMKAATKAAGRGDLLSYVNKTETREMTLSEKRQELVYDLAIAMDKDQAASARAHATSVGRTGTWQAVKAAEAAIAAFDAAHPEIKAAREAADHAAAQAAMWN